MMQIINQGIISSNKRFLKAVCNCCTCKFITDEYNIISSEVISQDTSTINEKYYQIDCPWCGNRIRIKIED